MDPHSIYSEKKRAYEEKLQSENKREDWCANARLFLFALSAVTGWWFYKGEAQNLLPALIPFGLFLVVATIHATILQKIAELDLGRAHFQRGIERIAGNWAGKGNCSRHHEPTNHVYARDLDLFGTGSLFELLDTTHSRAGERQLARWLLSVSSVPKILDRQQAVIELSSAVDDREALAIHAGRQGSEADGESLDEWAEGADRNHITDLKRMTALVAGMTLLIVGATFLGILPKVGYLFWPMGAWSLYRYSREYRLKAAVSLAHVEPDLLALRSLLSVARNHKAASSLLQSVDSALFDSEVSAEKLLGKLSKIIALKDAHRNQFFAPMAFLLFWDPIFVLLTEQWRLAYGQRLSLWVDAAGKRDALMALATFHFENPNFIMATVVEPAVPKKPSFEAVNLGHPFISATERVSNSLKLGHESSVLMLSGSNMSGKSTLLRTIGINTVLSLAGTCACASLLRLTPVHLGATLRVHDSLADGRSKFYAEIERLADLLKVAKGETPLLFLIDEIFHGTNSAARSVGAKRLIEEFIQLTSIGIVTTHDLSLADAVQAMQPVVKNIHLRDRVIDGELIFDYQIQPGVLKEGNALHLMRAVGLPI